jgi:hypothetical protein
LLSRYVKVQIYRTKSLPGVLYHVKVGSDKGGCLRIGCLRKIFGPKKDEVRRDWRKLHNEELNDHYSTHSIIRVIK